ncbi:hypothetical protein PIB30_054921 [Stylosanthes scabra]|uniref:Uncharacterized protein n=1 Tax=Stylosanthes scabra TaxID=79078 RepID=A0ABU6VM19_9FABA|nr:hypothetical protein [Stylosanthes scabra]
MEGQQSLSLLTRSKWDTGHNPCIYLGKCISSQPGASGTMPLLLPRQLFGKPRLVHVDVCTRRGHFPLPSGLAYARDVTRMRTSIFSVHARGSLHATRANHSVWHARVREFWFADTDSLFTTRAYAQAGSRGGLKDYILSAVAPLEIRRFPELVNKARVVEETTKTLAKDKDHRGGSSYRGHGKYVASRGQTFKRSGQKDIYKKEENICSKLAIVVALYVQYEAEFRPNMNLVIKVPSSTSQDPVPKS